MTFQTTHGMFGTPTYITWSSMKDRCSNPRNRSYPRYGGRGITVCARWATFENFLADMGPRLPDTQIDRIDNDGGYEPGNCRWATRSEQARNRRSSRMITHQGEELTLAGWASRTGISQATIKARLDKLGWTVERTLSTPCEVQRRGV